MTGAYRLTINIEIVHIVNCYRNLQKLHMYVDDWNGCQHSAVNWLANLKLSSSIVNLVVSRGARGGGAGAILAEDPKGAKEARGFEAVLRGGGWREGQSLLEGCSKLCIATCIN